MREPCFGRACPRALLARVKGSTFFSRKGSLKLTWLEGRPTFPRQLFSFKTGPNIEVQFLTPGTANQGLDRGWLSRGVNMQIGFTDLPNWLEMHLKLAHPRGENL